MVGHMKNLQAHEVKHPLASKATMKVLVSESEGWDNHVMRVLTVEAGGFTPKHAHPWPHINYIISGKGTLMIDSISHPVEAGSYAFVPANALHQFANAGDETFQFICIVPKEGHSL